MNSPGHRCLFSMQQEHSYRTEHRALCCLIGLASYTTVQQLLITADQSKITKTLLTFIVRSQGYMQMQQHEHKVEH